MSPSELTFSRSSPDPKVITVTAVEDDRYTGDRSSTLTLTADGYTMATVTVDITEEELQPIGLTVEPIELSLARFASTIITASIANVIDTSVDVRTTGAVMSPWGDCTNYDCSFFFTGPEYLGKEEHLKIELEGISVGEGTVTFKANKFKRVRNRAAPEKVVVNVTVTRPVLEIRASADELEIEAGTTEDLTVNVNYSAQVNPKQFPRTTEDWWRLVDKRGVSVPNVTLTAMVIGATDRGNGESDGDSRYISGYTRNY